MHQFKVSVFGEKAGETYSFYFPNIRTSDHRRWWNTRNFTQMMRLQRNCYVWWISQKFSEVHIRHKKGVWAPGAFPPTPSVLSTQHIARPVNKLLYGIGKLAASFLQRDPGVAIFYLAVIYRNFPIPPLAIPESVNCGAFKERVNPIEDTTWLCPNIFNLGYFWMTGWETFSLILLLER